ncbi:type III-A CRISPR-associated protein Cas10/Csm1 [Ilyomonas limi]|uniref:CRISPR system single-strand-specific deoxyribonuclease Cas10/Csm1 (subtype III-A) n=1 Tax=Ilyomonas limi TaxID=2575867 RepID=A0A4U3KTL1_9BACT|nr:type III-A CRISPR-associated protein Cas10/Csm1 [Ilyomonas limi]TKK65855.1 type III-A CRISPR-associated protein Cas10/Csm1 [Ilyomonas limi]
MDYIREQIYLAGLLHDIGKFYQRADESGASTSKNLSDNVKGLERIICPLHPVSKKYSHKHVLWTAQFFEDFESHLKQYLMFTPEFSYDAMLRLAAAHHQPTSFPERIIRKADHYSSGADRSVSTEAWKDAEEEGDKKWDAFKRISMRSVFDEVSLTESKKISEIHKLPISEIKLDRSFFPEQSDSENTYEEVWKKFIAELQLIQSRDCHSFNESLLFLLEKYMSRIPASTINLPDVSLYDHLKTTAAFAISLYDYVVDKHYFQSETLPDKDEKPFALIGGDLSGIQQFIYNIIARGAAKNLKGRSFYLQLLVDNIVQLILNEFALLSGNIIYASGGGFYILTANTINLPEKLKKLEEKIVEHLFNAHGTSLFLALDYVPFGEADLFYKEGSSRTIGDIWKELSDKLSAKKSQRFSHLLSTKFKEFFEPIAVSPEKAKDAITGEELSEGAYKLDKEDNGRGALMINKTTYQQIELGKKLKDADYWIFSQKELSYFPDKAFEPLGLNLYNYFVSEIRLKEYEERLKGSADNVRVLRINNTNFLQSASKGINNVYGFEWYGGNKYAINQFGEPKVFEELSGITLNAPNSKEDAKRESGPSLVRLGVLRMDVDNLGTIFRRGLPESKRSFSRYSTLSRSLDYFFKGYINTIWKDNKEFSMYTQIIYSGGDDLFIVGKWDVVIEMAYAIQKEFKEWVCHNPDITLSGGMASVGPKFPLLKAATYSERFEKAAKDYITDKSAKNAFSFINYTQYISGKPQEITMAFNWPNEFPYILQLKEYIKVLLYKKDIAEGFPSAMYNLMQQADFYYDEKERRYLPKAVRVIWLTAYQFKRSAQEKSDAAKSFYKSWVQNIMTGRIDEVPDTSYHALQLLATAARWASLEERSKL